jgi:hypothetical protein
MEFDSAVAEASAKCVLSRAIERIRLVNQLASSKSDFQARHPLGKAYLNLTHPSSLFPD